MNDIDHILEQTLILADECLKIFNIDGEAKNNARRQAILLLGAYLSSDTPASLSVKIMTFRQCCDDFKAEGHTLKMNIDADTDAFTSKIEASFVSIYNSLSDEIQTQGCVVTQEELLGYYKKAVEAVVKNHSLDARLANNRMSGDSDRFNSSVLLAYAQKFLQQQSFTHEMFTNFLNKVIKKAQACQSDLLLSVSGVSTEMDPATPATQRLKRSL